ncbi:MAG: hypothetical protein SFV22_03130 [Saprospiraceae bacterium]|nr:hypothetical protein [Saprospiraceae bacterium]
MLKYLLAVPIMLFSFFTTVVAQDVWTLYAAKNFNQRPDGAEKTTQIRAMEIRGWELIDTLYGLDGKVQYPKSDVSPFIDDQGESVFLVTEQPARFPGASEVYNDYLKNMAGDVLAGPDETIHSTLYIRFTVEKDGKVTQTAPAYPFSEWVPETTRQRCLDAVKNMPDWIPATYKGKPVKMLCLLTFGLRE